MKHVSQKNLMSSEDLTKFNKLLEQTQKGDPDQINSANTQLNQLFQENRSLYIFLAALTILNNPENSALTILSLSSIKKAVTPTRTFSIEQISELFQDPENENIRLKVRESLLNAIMNEDENIRRVAAGSIAYVTRIEMAQWDDLFSFILGIADETRGESGRFCVLQIFDEMLDLHLFNESYPDEISGFYELIHYTIRNDADSLILAMQCLRKMITEISTFFNSQEIIVPIFEIFETFKTCDNIEIYSENLNLIYAIYSTIPFDLLKTVTEDPTQYIVSLTIDQLAIPDVKFVKNTVKLWINLHGISASYTTTLLQEACSNILPAFLETGKRVEAEKYDYAYDDALQDYLGITFRDIYAEKMDETFDIISQFFNINIEQEDYHCKYAAYLSIAGLCVAFNKDYITQYQRDVVAAIEKFINESLIKFSLVGTEKYPHIVEIILCVECLIVESYPTILNESNYMLLLQTITNSTSFGPFHAKRAIELLTKIFKYGPVSLIFSQFKQNIDLIMTYIDDDIFMNTPTPALPFTCLQHLIQRIDFSIKECDISLVNELLEYFIGQYNAAITTVPEGIPPSLYGAKLQGFALVLTKFIQRMDRNIIPYLDQLVSVLFSFTKNDYLSDEFFIQMEALLQVFKKKPPQRAFKNDEEEDQYNAHEAEINSLILPYIEPMKAQIAASLQSGDPQQQVRAAKAYGRLFDVVGDAGSYLVGDEFQYMMDTIHPDDEDPLCVAPAMIEGIGFMLRGMQSVASPQDEVEHFYEKLNQMVFFTPNVFIQDDLIYANNLFNSITIGIAGLVYATDPEILNSKPTIRSLRLLFLNLSKQINRYLVTILNGQFCGDELLSNYIGLVDLLLLYLRSSFNVLVQNRNCIDILQYAVNRRIIGAVTVQTRAKNA